MKTYVGSKIIQAEPMDEVSFLTERGTPMVENQETRPGYKVVYPDGYVSWSPADAFETAYREITPSEKAMV